MPGRVVSSPPAASAQPGSRRNLSLGCYGHQRFLQLFMEKKAVGEQILHRVMSSGGKKKNQREKKNNPEEFNSSSKFPSDQGAAFWAKHFVLI